jgi:hypothetical protein
MACILFVRISAATMNVALHKWWHRVLACVQAERIDGVYWRRRLLMLAAAIVFCSAQFEILLYL